MQSPQTHQNCDVDLETLAVSLSCKQSQEGALLNLRHMPSHLSGCQPGTLALFSSLVVERKTLVGPDHVTTQTLGGKKN